MAEIAVDPFDLKDVDLEFDPAGVDHNFKAHVSTVQFVPTSSTSTWKGLAPSAVFTFGQKATWTCRMDFAQDWETTNSLAQYLLANEGEEVDVSFTPRSGQGPSFTATLILAAPPIGGTVDQAAVGSVTHGVKGKPVLVPAA